MQSSEGQREVVKNAEEREQDTCLAVSASPNVPIRLVEA